MIESILFLDDEVKILSAIRRLFIDTGLDVLTTDSVEEALEMVRKNRVAVIVSDNRMPAMKGTDFLEHAKVAAPDAVRIMMTGFVDLPTTIDAINRCGVYKFVVKPWDNDGLVAVVREALDRYRLVKSIRTSNEPTLLSLAQTVELKDRYTRGHCDRVAQLALAIAQAIGIDPASRQQIRYGSWLHDCGKIGVPEAILNKEAPLSPDEFEIIKKHPAWGADVARQAMLSDIVVNIILHHHERWDGKGYPNGMAGDAIPLEARIVSVADVFDALTSDRAYRKRIGAGGAKDTIASLSGVHFDPGLVEVFLKSLDAEGATMPHTEKER